jgi:hypothetical protein
VHNSREESCGRKTIRSKGCYLIIKNLLFVKFSLFQELMKLMGMEKWAFWLSWMLDALIVRTISVFLIVWLLTWPFNQEAGAVLVESDPSLIFFMLIVYCVAVISFLFAISTFFSRRKH